MTTPKNKTLRFLSSSEQRLNTLGWGQADINKKKGITRRLSPNQAILARKRNSTVLSHTAPSHLGTWQHHKLEIPVHLIH